MKQERNLIPALIIIGFATIALVVYLYIKAYTPKYSWKTDYFTESKQPYGLKLFYDVLKSDYSNDNFIEIKNLPGTKLDTNDISSLYICINRNIYIDSIEIHNLINFANKGNVVFVSAQNLTYDFIPYLTDTTIGYFDASEIQDSVIDVNFDKLPHDSVFHFDFMYNKNLKNFYWYGIDTTTLYDSLVVLEPEIISFINDTLVDCFRVRCGKGSIILHFNPLFFTNYHYSKEYGLNYVNHLFSPYKFKKVYWDEYSKSNHYTKEGKSADTDKESVFRFVFSQKSLKWSWFMIMGLTVLFFIFNIKRRYPVVPLLPENKNTTIEYINAIAMLHYQQGNLKFMADEIMKQFFVFVKNKYGVTKGDEVDNTSFAKSVSKFSGIPIEKIIGIFLYHQEIMTELDPKNDFFIDLYKSTTYFYKNCK